MEYQNTGIYPHIRVVRTILVIAGAIYGSIANASNLSVAEELLAQTPPVPSDVAMAAKEVAKAQQKQATDPGFELFADLRAQWNELRLKARKYESSKPFDAPLSEQEQAFISSLQTPREAKQLRISRSAEWQDLSRGWTVSRKPDFVRDPDFCSQEQRANFEARWQNHVAEQRAAVDRRLVQEAEPLFRQFQTAATKIIEVLRQKEGPVTKLDHPHAWIMYGTILSDLAVLQDKYLSALATLYQNAAQVDELPSYDAICKKKQARRERSQYTPSQGPSSPSSGEVSRAEVEAALTTLWKTVLAQPPQFGGRGPFLDVRPNLQCVRLSRAPDGATYSKDTQPLQWYVDIPESEATDERGQRLQRELSALVEAGVMRHARVEGDTTTASLWRNRYGFTDAGWVVTNEIPRDFCLRYGAPQLLGLVDYRSAVARKPGDQAFEVTFTVGFRSEDEIEPWARSTQVQKAFPMIGEYLKGQEIRRTLLRDERGVWTVRGHRAHQNIAPEADNSTVPSEARVKELLRQRLSETNSGLNVGHLCLPSQQSVDAWLGGVPGRARYSVALFDNATGSNKASVVASREYLDRLAALGVVIKSSEDQIPVHRGSSSPKHSGYVYELASPYRDAYSGPKGPCFSLGQPEVEVLALRIQAGPVEHAINYKARLHYAEVEVAELNPSLVEEWAELRRSMRQGDACEGLIGFSGATGELSRGGDRCWAVADW